MATTSKKPASKKTKTVRKVNTATAKKTTAKKAAPKKKTTTKKTTKSTNTGTAVVSAKVTKAEPAPRKTPRLDEMNLLRRMNIFAAVISAAQAALILWLSKAFGGIHAVTTSYPTNDSLAAAAGQQSVVTGTRHLFDVHLAWLIAAFMIVSAVCYLSIATWLRARYEREFGARLNRVRWINFAVSGSLVMLTVSMLAGISELSILVAMIAFTVTAFLVALSREHYTQNGERSRLVYGIGSLAAAAPWLVIAVYAFGAHQYGTGGTPMFVYWIYVTGLILFAAIAKNLLLQTRAKGRWAEYLFSERVFVGLSLVGNAAIAWQVYAGVLHK